MLLALTLLFGSCQKEVLPIKTQQATLNEFQTGVSYYVNQDAKEKIAHLHQVMRKSPAYKGKAIDSALFDWGYVDEAKVMQIRLVDDSSKVVTTNTTYRVIRYDHKHPNAFINLVLSENKYRKTLTLYGYIMSPKFTQLYVFEGAPLSEFEGSVYSARLELGPDAKNCPNEIGVIENLRSRGGTWGGGMRGEVPGLPGGSEPSASPGNNFSDNMDAVIGGQTSDGGGDRVADDGHNRGPSLWWIKVGNTLDGIGGALKDAWNWLTGGCNSCGPYGFSAPGHTTQIGGDGFVVIPRENYNPETPENPYTRGDYYGRDSCHRLAVGVLANLYSYEFIAGALSVEEQTTVTVEEVKWMKSHPDFSVPAILFLEQERFTDDSRVYFYVQLQKAMTDTSVADISYTGVFLNYHFELDENLAAYVWLTTEATLDQLISINDYFLDNPNDFENQELNVLLKAYIDIVKDLPSARFDRFVELKNLTELNPWVLIEECAQQNGLSSSNYLDLYNHQLPQLCLTRLNNLSFANQPINEGNVACANIDYYSVEITSNPDFNNDGQPDSKNEIFKAFKNEFTVLASGEKHDFHFTGINMAANIYWDFLPYNAYDLNLWNSNQNPVTTILGISAGSSSPLVDFTSDNGAIMISEYTGTHFIGSTIETSLTGSQPFSGNREWGVLINQNGNLEIYTRAVDVAKIAWFIRLTPDVLGPDNEESALTYYDIADATWRNLQKEVQAWVNSHGGQSTISTTTAIKVDREKIKALLESNESITEIGC